MFNTYGPSPARPSSLKRPSPSKPSGQQAAAVEKAPGPKKRMKKPPVPSFMFQPPAPPTLAEAKAPAAQEVEVFVTLAGRSGKGGSVTKPTSIEELERMVPVSFVPDVVPEPFADHLLRAFLEEAGSTEHLRWRR
ncbi:unnamed protein product [Symbiodinium natans]|uniref:Uncharacterized protein n=1 Tax=Symbiodinium natans TaxID=878477 RepID=A0A812TKR3_9DINO|nr:unnamed protein product [Symbiodinium natans]